MTARAVRTTTEPKVPEKAADGMTTPMPAERPGHPLGHRDRARERTREASAIATIVVSNSAPIAPITRTEHDHVAIRRTSRFCWRANKLPRPLACPQSLVLFVS